MGILESNLELLRQSQPRIAALIEASERAKNVQVITATNGSLVPKVGEMVLNSTEDPDREAREEIRKLLPSDAQRRVFLVGFGFGYQVDALCGMGLSPIVYEPDTSMLRLAFESRDFTQVIPFTTFYTGSIQPSIPPKTFLITHPLAVDGYPREMQRLQTRIVEDPPESGDMIYGIKSETYRNVTCLKNPLFMVCYEMIMSQVKPTVVLEVGACRGGSALAMSDWLNRMGGDRHLYTIDIVDEVAPEVRDQPNLTFYGGGHANFDLSVIKPEDRVMVVEDSSHTYENTLEVLERYSKVVTPNSYFIVEDTVVTQEEFHGGPMRAVEEFLEKDNTFERDKYWETFFGAEWEGHCIFLRKKLSL